MGNFPHGLPTSFQSLDRQICPVVLLFESFFGHIVHRFDLSLPKMSSGLEILELRVILRHSVPSLGSSHSDSLLHIYVRPPISPSAASLSDRAQNGCPSPKVYPVPKCLALVSSNRGQQRYIPFPKLLKQQAERVLAKDRPMIEQISQLTNGVYFPTDRNSTVADEPASQSENRDRPPWHVDSDQRWHFDSLPPPPEVFATPDFNAEIKHDDIEHEFTFER
jgi:hypothetical protein